MDILGVKIDNLSREEILEEIEGFLTGNKLCQIATVNPEFILEAQKNEEFKNILNNCDLNITDGVGIKFAFWRYGEKLKARIAGADLFWEILKIASDRKYSIFLAASKGGLSTWKETRDAILKKYPDLEINGYNLDCHSKQIPPQAGEVEESNLDGIKFLDYARDDISGSCEIIFCSFGVPFQEKFLHSLKTLNNSKIRLVMGVGGSFDYLTGRIKRAPEWMRQLGFEWLFRLISEPRYRIKRIFNAIIIFPIKIIINKKTYDNQS